MSGVFGELFDYIPLILALISVAANYASTVFSVWKLDKRLREDLESGSNFSATKSRAAFAASIAMTDSVIAIITFFLFRETAIMEKEGYGKEFPSVLSFGNLGVAYLVHFASMCSVIVLIRNFIRISVQSRVSEREKSGILYVALLPCLLLLIMVIVKFKLFPECGGKDTPVSHQFTNQTQTPKRAAALDSVYIYTSFIAFFILSLVSTCYNNYNIRIDRVKGDSKVDDSDSNSSPEKNWKSDRIPTAILKQLDRIISEVGSGFETIQNTMTTGSPEGPSAHPENGDISISRVQVREHFNAAKSEIIRKLRMLKSETMLDDQGYYSSEEDGGRLPSVVSIQIFLGIIFYLFGWTCVFVYLDYLMAQVHLETHCTFIGFLAIISISSLWNLTQHLIETIACKEE